MANANQTISVSVALHPIFVHEINAYLERVEELGLNVSDAEVRARVDLYWRLWPPTTRLTKSNP